MVLCIKSVEHLVVISLEQLVDGVFSVGGCNIQMEIKTEETTASVLKNWKYKTTVKAKQ